MSINEEEELIRLNEIFKTLREDAFEVTELVVKGINSYKVSMYITIAAGLFSLWNLSSYIGTSNLFQIGFWIICTIFFFVAGPVLFRKNRQLKKKYQELISIHESLSED